MNEEEMKLEKRYWREYDGYQEWLSDILEENDKLKLQLQAYKDKEDKLREFIRRNRYSDGMHITIKGVENLLQILNEGSEN